MSSTTEVKRYSVTLNITNEVGILDIFPHRVQLRQGWTLDDVATEIVARLGRTRFGDCRSVDMNLITAELGRGAAIAFVDPRGTETNITGTIHIDSSDKVTLITGEVIPYEEFRLPQRHNNNDMFQYSDMSNFLQAGRYADDLNWLIDQVLSNCRIVNLSGRKQDILFARLAQLGAFSRSGYSFRSDLREKTARMGNNIVEWGGVVPCGPYARHGFLPCERLRERLEARPDLQGLATRIVMAAQKILTDETGNRKHDRETLGFIMDLGSTKKVPANDELSSHERMQCLGIVQELDQALLDILPESMLRVQAARKKRALAKAAA